jgi:hypothetical protein
MQQIEALEFRMLLDMSTYKLESIVIEIITLGMWQAVAEEYRKLLYRA